MIRNEFIHELDIDLDIHHISELVFQEQFNYKEGYARHHRFVSDDQYMSALQKKYPLLSGVYNIYTLENGKGIPLHIDTDRSCALNIPIKNTEVTETIFYNSENSIKTRYDPKMIYDVVISPVGEIFRHRLTVPTLINNSIPHQVVNKPNNTRITVSWSFYKEVKFDQAIKIFYE
jgi:hypothetical protein